MNGWSRTSERPFFSFYIFFSYTGYRQPICIASYRMSVSEMKEDTQHTDKIQPWLCLLNIYELEN